MFLNNRKSKVLLYFIVTLLFLTAAPITTVGTEVNPVNIFAEGEENNSIALEDINVVDCPEDIFDEQLSSRVILQIINNTFHKWKEYDLGDKGEFCIFLEEPEWRPLTAEEARGLLAESQGWVEQSQQVLSLEDAATVKPEDMPDRKSLMPYTDEPRPDWVDDYITDEPDSAVYRSDFLETMSSMVPEHNDFVSQTEMDIRLKNIFGIYERERISFYECTNYPWNTIGFIESAFGFSGYFRGTGFLISPYTVLTNAHNLYSSDYGGWFNGLTFYPGQYQAYQGGPVSHPYGQRDAVDAMVPQLYIDYEDSLQLSNAYDYGAFFIETPFDGISTYMPLEFDYYDDPSYIYLAGYPAEVRGETDSLAMWHSFGPVTNFWERELTYRADATLGNSGSPVWVYNDQTNISRVVGLLAQVGAYYNTGPRLTHHNKPLIEEWMRWTPTPTTVPVTSVSLNKTNITLTQGATETLIAEVSPANATNKSVIWSSSNNSVATVNSNGVVTAIAPGTAVITVRTEDGNKTADCIVTVTQIVKPAISVSMGVERKGANTLELTAASTGGTNVEYRYDMRIMDSGRGYQTIRGYSSDPNFIWTGADDGEIYELVVHADAEDAEYNAYYVVFGNTPARNPFTGLQTEVTAEGNQVRITAIPQGGTNIIYALQYREGGGRYNPLDPANPYQASPVFVKTLGQGSYEFVVHAIDVASGSMQYQGSYSPFTTTQSAFESLNATVDSLRFYESDDHDTTPYDQRVYSSTFDKNSTRFVYYKLDLDYPAPGRRVDFFLRAVYSFSGGDIIADFENDYYVESDWFSSSHSSGYGWHEPGYWPTGSYTVQIFDGSSEIARGQFTVK